MPQERLVPLEQMEELDHLVDVALLDQRETWGQMVNLELMAGRGLMEIRGRMVLQENQGSQAVMEIQVYLEPKVIKEK